MKWRVSFIERPIALEPAAAAISGEAAKKLARALLEKTDAQLLKLSGLTAGDTLLITGPTSDLPWVESVLYLGRDPSAPRLLLPTALTPDVPADVFEAAIAKTNLPFPVAVLPSPKRLISMHLARPIERALLTAWLGS
ncbi:MAG: hypothetical protein IPK82_01915 [Polyangiaceae bacterium]|nr:hypothetical protein [Polyangiaceae bacterium]